MERIDRSRIRLTDEESLTSLSYAVHGSFDPKNPVDTALYPSANWYYFRMTGVKGKQIYLTGVHNSVPRTSYSYDGEHWAHLPLGESDRLLLDKYFTRDTVFLAVPAEKKARIWIHGRQHPSETPASYLVDGLVEYLTSDTPEGKALRRQLDTYVLPFANPDGVADGLSRSNALGVNQEINFGRSDDSTVVEVKAIKETLTRLTAERPFDFLLNSHSQHAESATFWMHRGSSSSPAYFRKQWAFTGLVSSFNPCIRPLDMNFSDIAPRYVEGWSWERFGDRTIALTIETTYNCYSFDRDGLWADNDNIRDFGKRTLQAMAEYLGLSLPGRYVVETPARMAAGWEAFPDESRSYLGQNAWQATRSGAAVNYTLDQLPAGRYDIYRYVAGDCIEPEGQSDLRVPDSDRWTDPGIHGWGYEATVSQPRSGRFTYTYKAKEAGDTADARLVLRCDPQAPAAGNRP